jgi:hypothetical protein
MLGNSNWLKFNPVLALTLASVTVFCSPAWAKKPLQTYAATEDESEIAPAPVSTSVSKPKATSTQQTPQTGATLFQTPAEKAKFEPVPPDQVDSIARRLKLVENLLRKHGRAYDYRIHTLKELESIQASLEPSPTTTEPPADEPALPLPPKAEADML